MTAEEQSTDPILALRRIGILETCREAPRSRRDIAAAVDASRATVYRATDELIDEGLLTRVDGGYRTTPRGRAVTRVAERYRRGIDAVDRLDALFAVVDHPDLFARAHLLADADLTVADETNSYRASDRLLERWADADRVRMAAATRVNRICLDACLNTTADADVDAELVFDPAAVPTIDQLRSASFDRPELFEHFELLVSETVPFTFVLYDDHAAIAGYNELCIPVVLAESDDPALYRWLETRYAACVDAANPLEDGSL